MRLSTLLKNSLGISLLKDHDREITGLSADSRTLKPDEVFCAYPGTQADGRQYIPMALDKGAAAILYEANNAQAWESSCKNLPIPIIPIAQLQSQLSHLAEVFYHYPARGMQLIGITGTNGKTSCTHFIGHCLMQAGKPCGIIGSLGNGFYYPQKGYQPITFSEKNLTTPDAIYLQYLLSVFREHDIKIVAIEASSQGIAQGRLNRVPLTIAAFTNLTQDHLDYHDSLEAYAATKKRLFTWPTLHHVIFNTDDAYGLQWQQQFYKKLPTYSYSTTPPSFNKYHIKHYYADAIKTDELGLSAIIHTPSETGKLHNRHLLGQFNLSNLLLVITILEILGISLSDSLNYITQLKPIKGRMDPLGGKAHQPLVVIDYAHTPDALEKALQTLKQPNKHLWCLFGCGGNRDQGKRPLMGRIAEQYAQHVIITDDNPRQEDSQQIIQAILSGMHTPQKAIVIPDRRLAITHALQSAADDDIVLIAGKGHEAYQIMGTTRHPWSDYEIVKTIIAEK